MHTTCQHMATHGPRHRKTATVEITSVYIWGTGTSSEALYIPASSSYVVLNRVNLCWFIGHDRVCQRVSSIGWWCNSLTTSLTTATNWRVTLRGKRQEDAGGVFSFSIWDHVLNVFDWIGVCLYTTCGCWHHWPDQKRRADPSHRFASLAAFSCWNLWLCVFQAHGLAPGSVQNVNVSFVIPLSHSFVNFLLRFLAEVLPWPELFGLPLWAIPNGIGAAKPQRCLPWKCLSLYVLFIQFSIYSFVSACLSYFTHTHNNPFNSIHICLSNLSKFV